LPEVFTVGKSFPIWIQFVDVPDSWVLTLNSHSLHTPLRAHTTDNNHTCVRRFGPHSSTVYYNNTNSNNSNITLVITYNPYHV